MSRLKDLFQDANPTTFVSLENMVEPVTDVVAAQQDYADAASLAVSLEGLIEYGKVIDPNNVGQVNNFHRVVDAVVYPITGQMYSTESLNVTVEGLTDVFNKIVSFLKGRKAEAMKDLKEGEEIKPYSKQAQEIAKKALEHYKKYHLNDKWLDSQTFAEGDVSGSALAPLAAFGGISASTPTDYIKNIESYIDYCKAVKNSADDLTVSLGKISDAISVMAKGLDPDNDDDCDKLQKFIEGKVAEVKKYPSMLKKHAKKLEVFGGHVFTVTAEGASATKVNGTADKVPALDKAGVKAAAQAAAKALEAYTEAYSYLPLAGLFTDDSTALSEFLSSAHDVADAVEEWMNISDAHRIEDKYNLFSFVIPLEGQLAVARAFDKWIGQSIK